MDTGMTFPEMSARKNQNYTIYSTLVKYSDSE